MTILILVSFQLGLSSQMVFSGVGAVVYGISTMLIHARVRLGWAYNSRTASVDRVESNPTRVVFEVARSGESASEGMEQRGSEGRKRDSDGCELGTDFDRKGGAAEATMTTYVTS